MTLEQGVFNYAQKHTQTRTSISNYNHEIELLDINKLLIHCTYVRTISHFDFVVGTSTRCWSEALVKNAYPIFTMNVRVGCVFGIS